MHINFLNDLAKLYRKSLVNVHGPRDEFANSTPEKIILEFLKHHHRTLKNNPRSIKASNNLFVPKECKVGLSLLEKKAKNGEDLNSFLRSHKSIKFTPNDMMLNDWNIYHFHLGAVADETRHVVRTDLLLYAFITDDSIYEICIAPHGKWFDKELLEVIHQNWPDLLINFRTNISNLNYLTNSEKEIKNNRDKGFNYLITLSDGTTLQPVGGGYTIDGTSDYVMDIYIYLIQEIKRLEAVAGEFYKNNKTVSEITLCVNVSSVFAACNDEASPDKVLPVRNDLMHLFCIDA